MRAADDFATIRARMKELERDRNPEPTRESHWRLEDLPVEEIVKKTKELLRGEPKGRRRW